MMMVGGVGELAKAEKERKKSKRGFFEGRGEKKRDKQSMICREYVLYMYIVKV